MLVFDKGFLTKFCKMGVLFLVSVSRTQKGINIQPVPNMRVWNKFRRRYCINPIDCIKTPQLVKS